jgi:prepilin-type N-terminal cleavage/methylation domain-containing protein
MMKNSGYTLIEVVVVIVIGGIMAATVGIAARKADKDSKAGRALHQILSDVRYSQELATAQNLAVNFYVNTGNQSYSARYVVAGTYLKSALNRRDMLVYMDTGPFKGVRITYTAVGSALTFTRTGDPQVGGTAIASNLTVATVNGGKSVVINPAGYTFIQ